MSRGHDVRIEQENERVAKVYIDGKKLEGVQYVDYKFGVNDIPIITVEFIPSTLNFDKEDKKDLKLTVNVDSDEIIDKVIERLNKQLKLEGCKVGFKVII